MSRFTIRGGALTLALSLLIVSSPSFADPVNKGALVLRSGAADGDDNYANQDVDSNGKLQDVSALCSPDASNKGKSADLITTDKTRNQNKLFQAKFGATQASTITGLGGKVVTDPLDRNPNHCLISGLKVSQIKGVWTMCNVGNNPQCP